jgi:4-hydroxybutyrate CoA-transferase
LLIGIKFCGGCNPRYNRKELANRLMEELKSFYMFEFVCENREYDKLLVICGCMNCCAQYKNILVKNDIIVINNNMVFQDIIERIKNN